MTWLSNEGINDDTPNQELPFTTLVQVRFKGSMNLHVDDFDDEGELDEFFWGRDNDPSDIDEYRIVELPE